jgi:hypothetical protein
LKGSTGIIRRELAAPKDGERRLGVGHAVAETLPIDARRRLGCYRRAAAQVSDQYLGHGQAVVRCLLGNLFQPVDAPDAGLDPLFVAELVDGPGEPFAGLALQG